MIPYGRQDITEKDVEAVVKVLHSDFLTQGEAVPTFEKNLCDYTGAKYAVSVNSCTSALHIACLALGLAPGDILWTSPITFVASANCALYCGASVDFVDIEPDTGLMSAKKLEDKLKLAEKEGKIPKIVIPVHFSGQPCDMKEIYNLSQQYGFNIIEDAAHAIGSTYQGDIVGNCQYSDITVFSFHPVKIITTGEGGAAMTNNSLLAEKMDLLRSHGITRDLDKIQKNPDGPWYYEQMELGYNYRMTDIQAALGSSQISRLDQYILRRTEIVRQYNNYFENISVNPLLQKPDRISAHHLYVIRVEGDEKMRRELYDYLHENSISVNVHYIPVNKQIFHKKYSKNNTPIADFLYKKIISLPLFFRLTDEEVAFICSQVGKGSFDLKREV
jgi:UDP-4-amino-4,6-dideoxy-N-acetyl-beta-L-altrosamine transaminase